MNALWHGTTKDRKAIIKSFKTFVVKTAKEEHGYMAILAMLDSVDDTKLLEKAILSEMIKDDETIEDVIDDERARKVLYFALVGRCKTYFHPDVLANLSQGDGNANSKKPLETRQKEVSEAVREKICKFAEKNLDKFLANNQLTLFLGALVQSCPEDDANGNY